MDDLQWKCPSNLALGRWLYRLRVRRGLSQEQVALEAGISVATYGRLERCLAPGESVNPRFDTIARILEAVDAGPADFHALLCVGAPSPVSSSTT